MGLRDPVTQWLVNGLDPGVAGGHAGVICTMQIEGLGDIWQHSTWNSD